MCLAVPGRIIETDGQHAKVDFGGVTRDVNVTMVEAEPGEYVIVHAGFAIQKLHKTEAEASLALFKELLDKDVGAQS